MAAVVKNGKIEMAEETVKSIMLLNKLWIPDVLIDIIKDFLYINTATVLRNYYKTSINLSIKRLTVNYWDMTDSFGRIRLTHWAIGHVYGEIEVQLQEIICISCGHSGLQHMNFAGCCDMEGDGEEGTLVLSEVKRVEEDDNGLFYYSEEEEEEDW